MSRPNSLPWERPPAPPRVFFRRPYVPRRPLHPGRAFTGAAVLAAVLFGAPAARAQTDILLRVGGAETRIEAREKNGTLWVDAGAVAESLGLEAGLRGDVLEVRFSTYTLALDAKNARVRMRGKREGKWRDRPLESGAYFLGTRLMLPLEDLPEIFNRGFSYHLQKKILEAKPPASAEDAARLRPLSLRHHIRNHKAWISLEDLVKALGVVLYSSQADVYNLVMPDFRVFQLRVGESWLYRRNVRHRPLEDPLLLLEGSPYLSVDSIGGVFGVEARWDRPRRVLLVPAPHGRGPAPTAAESNPLRLLGYRPEPLRFRVEEMSAYYQTPAPSYPAPDNEVYESVRDFFTHRPRRLPDASGADHVGGTVLAGLKGGLFGAPLEGRGEFEKVGPNARTVNGGLRWGFPKFEVRGGREYVQMANFNAQFERMDFISVGHSSDHYGERSAGRVWTAKARYGRDRFSVFMSTALFSQTVEYVQDMVSGEAAMDWDVAEGQTLGVTLGQHQFINRVRGISSDNYADDFLREIFGDDFLPPADPGEAKALASDFLGARHGVSLLDVNYQWDRAVDLTGTMGVSYFREESAGRPWTVDRDWKLRAVLGGQRGKLDASFESAGKNYRSLGDPRRYQDRRVTRLSPSIGLTRVWKIYGEFRREDSGVLEKTGGSAYRNDYWTLGQSIGLKKGSLRFYGSNYDSTLYGKRWSGNLDHTRYFGRDSVNIGGAWASQWAAGNRLYRQSYTGRTGFEILRPSWRFSLSEELTRHHYPWHGIGRWESDARLAAQAGRYKALLEYSFAPRYFMETAMLHTSLLQIGRQVDPQKIVNVFFSTTGLRAGLRRPEVWRAGVAYTYDF